MRFWMSINYGKFKAFGFLSFSLKKTIYSLVYWFNSNAEQLSI